MHSELRQDSFCLRQIAVLNIYEVLAKSPSVMRENIKDLLQSFPYIIFFKRNFSSGENNFIRQSEDFCGKNIENKEKQCCEF